MKRLDLRIMERENLNSQPMENPIVEPTVNNPPTAKPPSQSKQPEMMNDSQVSEYLSVSVFTLHRWRLSRHGPKFLKVGSAVRY